MRRIRHGKRATQIPDWVSKGIALMQTEELNSFIFDGEAVYVLTQFNCEFSYLPQKMGGLLGAEYKNGFELCELEILKSILNGKHTILDVGANYGFYAIHLAKIFPNSFIHCFEPVLDTAKLLRNNCERNDVSSKVKINSAAVGAAVGITKITTDRYAGNHILTDKNYQGTAAEVTLTTIDEYVSVNAISEVEFIKCDVEGFELEVMEGASKTISKFRPIILLEIAIEWEGRTEKSISHIFNYMIEQNYQSFTVGDLACILKTKFAPHGTYNHFFLPKESKLIKKFLAK